jgi:hypothetical protein
MNYDWKYRDVGQRFSKRNWGIRRETYFKSLVQEDLMRNRTSKEIHKVVLESLLEEERKIECL